MGDLCVKGVAFGLAHRDVNALLEGGTLSRARLETRLPAEDLALLDENPLPSGWYPLASYERLLRILLELEGANDPDYLVERGRKGIAAIMESGIYRQLRRIEEQEGDREGDWFERVGHSLVTFPSAIFSEGRWKLSKGEAPRLFTLVGEDLGSFPTNVARIVEGAVQHLASRMAEAPVHVTTQQPADGRILFVGTTP